MGAPSTLPADFFQSKAATAPDTLPADFFSKRDGHGVSDDFGPEEPKGSASSRFFDPLNPMHVVHEIFKPSDDPKEDPRVTFGKNVIGMVRRAADATNEHADAALEYLKKGDLSSALGHAFYAIPVLGQIGDDAAQKFQNGDIAGGAGSLTSLLAPKALKEAAPLISDLAVKSAPIIKDAVVGGAKGGAEMTSHFGLKVPAVVTGAATGGFAARMLGLPHAAGAAVGAALPVVRGAAEAIKAGRDARAALSSAAAIRAATEARAPVWQGPPAPEVAPAPVEAPVAAEPAPVSEPPSTALPSGRLPGKYNPDQPIEQPQPAPERHPIWGNLLPQETAPPPEQVASPAPSQLPSGRIPGKPITKSDLPTEEVELGQDGPNPKLTPVPKQEQVPEPEQAPTPNGESVAKPNPQEIAAQLAQELNLPKKAPVPRGTNAMEASNRSDMARDLAKAMHIGGMTYKDAIRMKAPHWQHVADAVSILREKPTGSTSDLPSNKTRRQAVVELRKLEQAPVKSNLSPSPQPDLSSTGSWSPETRSIAEKLRDEMQ